MKVELESNRHQLEPVELSSHGNQRVFLSGTFLRSAQPLLVFSFVLKLEAVDRLQVRKELLPAVGIQKNIESLPRPNTHVVITLGTYFLITIKIGSIQSGIAINALLPESLGNTRSTGGCFVLADPRRKYLIDPAHSKLRTA